MVISIRLRPVCRLSDRILSALIMEKNVGKRLASEGNADKKIYWKRTDVANFAAVANHEIVSLMLTPRWENIRLA